MLDTGEIFDGARLLGLVTASSTGAAERRTRVELRVESPKRLGVGGRVDSGTAADKELEEDIEFPSASAM